MTPDLVYRVLGDRRLRLGVMLVVLAVLAQQLSLLVWALVPEPDLGANQAATTVVRNAQPVDAGANFRQQANMISRAFLFGKVEVAQKVVEVVEEAPQTELNYKLRGVYFSPNENLSSAIVETRPNNSKHYLLGDEMADKITLAGIQEDHILINRFGKLERLDLEKPKAPKQSGRSQASAGAGSANHTALLRNYKKRYSSNPMALATRFQAIPVQQDGKNIGFKLKALRGESLLRKLSFQPNDVFTEVNGVSLKNPFEALDALKSLTTADRVSVTFMRNGAEQTMDFQI